MTEVTQEARRHVDVSGRRVFLSGPVTGLDYEEARDAFDAAEVRLRVRGARSVLNPASVVPRECSHEDAMLMCLHLLTTYAEYVDGRRVRPYDLLVSLPGWERSEGARVERMVALAVGIPVAGLAEVPG